MKALGFALLLALAACGRPEPAGPARDASQIVVQDNVSYHAETLLLESFPVQVATNVSIRNRADSPVTITFPDGCVVQLRVYRDAARTALAYDMARQFGCTMALVPVTLAANGTKEFSAPTISASKILGDSLPNGRYYFSAVIRPNGRQLVIPAGSAELAQ
ncbi:MAG: BsuPI-related putative proteinase inhibitor [Gemmatimonadota bacterium]